MPDLLSSRALRWIVLVAALGVGGVAGAPTMAMPPRAGITMSGGDGDPDDDGPGGGGGTPPDGPIPLPGGARQLHGVLTTVA